ncbi:unnamed protein product [Musa acuminata subsp. burmannicoides]
MAFRDLRNPFFFLLLALATSPVVLAGDPDITSDFVLPPNTNAVNGSFFTFTGMRCLLDSSPPTNFTVLKATMAEFPALGGQSVSYAVLSFPAGSVNPPHTHPRAAELLFLIDGYLEVGFVDTANKLYTQTLQPGTCLCSQRTRSLPVLQPQESCNRHFCLWECKCWHCIGSQGCVHDGHR